MGGKLHFASKATDFGTGSVSGAILRLAAPLMAAQLINVLYSVVDRIYLGHMAQSSVDSLTGIGLSMPIITLITAFVNWISMGGAPLFSMARGAQDEERAGHLLGTAATILIAGGILLSLGFRAFMRPLLYLFGASDATIPYAMAYLSIYLWGTLFMALSVGLNPFINAQGFGVIGMLTVSIGAVLNLILDPIFIFVLDLGIRGAALATVLSQFVSAVWAVRFLTGKQALIPLKKSNMRPDPALTREIAVLGLPGFIVYGTNALVQIACNVTLHDWGGDIYVSVMTLLNSVREVTAMPMHGVGEAAKPVLGFNYGAKKFDRVTKGIVFETAASVFIATLIWGLVFFFPEFFIRIFNSEPEILRLGVPAIHLYFFGFCFMALQTSGQIVFQALGMARRAIFFSLFRKVLIVVPLTMLLPYVANLGTDGVFLAEPISNLIGGGACFCTMMLTVWRKLRRQEHS